MKWVNGLMVVLVAAVLAGCGSKEIDENKPIDQVAAEAAEMGQAELQKMVDQYEPLIQEKTEQLAALKDQLSELSVGELLGEKAKSLKTEMGDLSSSVKKLQEQLSVYTDALSSAE